MISALVVWSSTVFAAELTAEKTDKGVTIKVDGQLFTEYLVKSGAKPILWPILGPGGGKVTRSFPLSVEPAEQSDRDHVHQRSLWCTHGDVNHIDFWSEEPGHGTIEHREFLKVVGGREAVIETRNDWLGPDGRKQCEDVRTLRFRADEDSRSIDFDIVVEATAGDVTFGDTKEGSLGMRVATSLKVDSKQGGQIVNSEGQTDGAAWGKRASWVDYHGPVDGQTAGIAILNHPASYGYPTYWHVRTYGLFAANPFGVHAFTESGDGAHTIKSGETMALRYRILIHRGDEKSAKVAEAFALYAKEPRQ